jgi:hypothetical protein
MATEPISPRSHRLSDVLEGPWSKVIPHDLDLASNLPIGVIRHTNPARFGNGLKTRCNVDAVTEDVVFVDDDIPDMDADPELDLLILRHRGVLVSHAKLDFEGTPYRIYSAGEFDQHSVPGRFDDAASMGGYRGINEGLPNRL